MRITILMSLMILSKIIKKKIFLITGFKSFKLSSAQEKLKETFKNLDITYYFKNNYPEIKELIKIISLINQSKPNLILAIGGGSYGLCKDSSVMTKRKCEK